MLMFYIRLRNGVNMLIDAIRRTREFLRPASLRSFFSTDYQAPVPYHTNNGSRPTMLNVRDDDNSDEILTRGRLHGSLFPLYDARYIPRSISPKRILTFDAKWYNANWNAGKMHSGYSTRRPSLSLPLESGTRPEEGGVILDLLRADPAQSWN